MTIQLRADLLNPEHLQAAVANLVQESLQDPSSLLRCTQDLLGWTPAEFRTALASAAQGETLALQSGWLSWPTRDVPTHIHTSSLNLLICYWDELLTELARGGHVSVLQAFYSRPPTWFNMERVPSFLEVAIRAGPDSPVLQWLASSALKRATPLISPHKITAAAAREGCLDSLQWLRRPAGLFGWDPVECAALISDTPAWQQLKASSACHIQALHGSAALCTLAAAGGDADLLRKLRSATPPCPFEERTVALLAQHGHTTALANLLPPSPAADASPSELLEMAFAAGKAAATHGQLETLRWIWQQHAPSADSPPSATPLCLIHRGSAAEEWMRSLEAQEEAVGIGLKSFKNPDVAYWAIGISKAALNAGQVGILEWLWDRCPQAFWQQQACDYAAKRCHTSLRWLLALYPPCHWEPADLSSDEMLRAIKHHRHLPSPGLLDQIVSSMSSRTCSAAAEPGNLELIKYLHSRQCQWDVQSCLVLAAKYGHLHLLQWMCDHEPSRIWDANLSNVAAQWGRHDVLLWLLQHHPSWPLPTRPEQASDRCLALLVQWNCHLTPIAQARIKAMGPLSPSLVIGLARWQRRCKGMGCEAQQIEAARFEDRRGQQLLSHLSGLPDDIIMHICCLADMCRPLPG